MSRPSVWSTRVLGGGIPLPLTKDERHQFCKGKRHGSSLGSLCVSSRHVGWGPHAAIGWRPVGLPEDLHHEPPNLLHSRSSTSATRHRAGQLLPVEVRLHRRAETVDKGNGVRPVFTMQPTLSRPIPSPRPPTCLASAPFYSVCWQLHSSALLLPICQTLDRLFHSLRSAMRRLQAGSSSAISWLALFPPAQAPRTGTRT